MTEAAEPYSLEVRKWDVIDILRRRFGATSYIQITSPSTSWDVTVRPELLRFARTTSLSFASEMQRRELPWTAALPTLRELEQQLSAAPLLADIVYLDPWHSYGDSVRTLMLALGCLHPGGHLVIHDCDPYSLEATAELPESCGDAWCGATWRVVLDVSARLGAEWPRFTVDTDCGVGVIRAPHRLRRSERRRLGRDAVVAVPRHLDVTEAWEWLQTHRSEVLHLQERSEWKTLIDADIRPVGWPWVTAGETAP